jgi:hypothetical protein
MPAVSTPLNVPTGSPDGFAIGGGRADYDSTIYVARPSDMSASVLGNMRDTLSMAPSKQPYVADESPEPPNTPLQKLGEQIRDRYIIDPVLKDPVLEATKDVLTKWAPSAGETLEFLSTRANFWLEMGILAVSPTPTAPSQFDQPSKEDLIRGLTNAQARSWSQQRAQQLQALTADTAALPSTPAGATLPSMPDNSATQPVIPIP